MRMSSRSSLIVSVTALLAVQFCSPLPTAHYPAEQLFAQMGSDREEPHRRNRRSRPLDRAAPAIFTTAIP
jgi:hypothetical protein